MCTLSASRMESTAVVPVPKEMKDASMLIDLNDFTVSRNSMPTVPSTGYRFVHVYMSISTVTAQGCQQLSILLRLRRRAQALMLACASFSSICDRK